jgi:hypothetical protein
MSIKLTDIVNRNDELVFAQMGDEVVMMSQDQGEYFGLNVVASAVWDLVETPRSVSELCEGLQGKFNVSPEQCQVEVLQFLEQMKENGLIEVRVS